MNFEHYRNILRDRLEQTYEEWRLKSFISEKELYTFLDTLKEMADEFGMSGVAGFTESQLNKLSSSSENRIPFSSLVNYWNRIAEVVERDKELVAYDFSDLPTNRFGDGVFVLVIGDKLESVSYIKGLIEKLGAQVLVAMSGKRGIEQFYSMRPNYVFTEVKLPDMTAFDILDQIAEAALVKRVPIMVFSEDFSNQNRIAAYEKGAMDYIRMPLELDVFVPYLLNRENIRKSMDESVFTDGLTGIGNRRYFDDCLHEFSSISERTGLNHTLVMVDIDYFKKVNDRYGHMAGDKVLRKFGEMLRNVRRDGDKVFRYGGEEFAVILANTNVEEADELVKRFRNRFNDLVFDLENDTFSVTFSAGIAEYRGDSNKMILTADRALYEAKRTGRNKTVIFTGANVELKRKVQVIIVDDDLFFRTMLSDMLKGWTSDDIDVSVKTFEDGPSFLQSDWYRNDVNIIILLDGVMPHMDGLEVLGRLKQVNDEKNVLVSMMTARTSEADIKTALWLGADDYIMKPFKPEEVLLKIQNLAARMFK
ncbi:diguanylate cyclase [Sporosarcina sp. Sa2YVA2]|uniref:Diguanylate cyclase n=1 Tax=Sporosarcina quadrami TaxID=2762234 RepID=A0ABR8U6U0_9BACL|nr:diguanylate cyclase [Sporosarcina quadrami]MBD7983750.1 diguanylate cyclase [Sporosarcina quadrami]